MKTIELDILELLGEGGQGRVFKAVRRDRATNLSQMIAVKVLHSENAVELWKKEFESLARVRSPYCLQVYSFDRLDGHPALHLEFVEGLSLTDLGRGLLLDPDEVDEILAQIQAGLKDLQMYGVQHGDLSPNNVLVDVSGRVRLVDFGLANSSEHIVRLTPDFAAPERLQGSAPNPQSDLFSLGRIERYLRGLDLNTFDQGEFLQLDPSKRCFRAHLQSDPERRRILGAKVLALMQRQKMQRVQTRTIEGSRTVVGPRPRVHLLVLVFTLMLAIMGTRGATATSPSPQRGPATLSISTQTWRHLQLDGRDLGYAPVQLHLEPNTEHVLRWTSAKGSGQRRIRLQPQQRVHLTDRDLTH